MANAWEKAKVVQPAQASSGSAPAWASARVVSPATGKNASKKPTLWDDYKAGVGEAMDAFTEQQNRVEARRAENERTNNTAGRIADAFRYPADQALTALTAVGAAASPVFTAPLKAASRPYSDLMYDTGVEFRTPNLNKPELGPLSLIPIIAPVKNKTPEGREANRQVTETMMNAAAMGIGGLGGNAGKAARAARGVENAAVASRAERQALRMVAKDLKKAGPKAADAMARNPDLTVAEAVGERGMKRVKVLGEMDDLGLRDEITGAMSERIASTPGRINRAAEARTGIVPEAGEANIDAATVRGQKAAEPFYREAYQQTVDSPVLRGLLQRPGVQEAMRPATKGILNQGRSPYFVNETIALPDSLPTGAPTGDAAGYLDDVQALSRGNGPQQAGGSLSERLAGLDLPQGATPRQAAQALADDDAALRNLQDFADGRQGSLAPSVVEEVTPTMERLDKTKRYLDDAVRDARARGRNETANDLDAARSDLVSELRTLNPTYAKALDTASDYLKNKSAFEASARQFSGGSAVAYRQYVAGLSGPEKEANLAGLLADFDKKMGTRTGGPKAFLDTLNSPAIREKLAIAAEHLGPDVGAKLHHDIANAIEVRNNAARMMPKASKGSTRDLESDLLAEATGNKGGNIPSTRAGWTSSLVNMVADPARQAWYRARLMKGAPTLKAYARLMVQQGDITIQQINSLPQGGFKSALLRAVQDLPRNAATVRRVGSLGAGVNAAVPTRKSEAPRNAAIR